jgi:hypothetical protein
MLKIYIYIYIYFEPFFKIAKISDSKLSQKL